MLDKPFGHFKNTYHVNFIKGCNIIIVEVKYKGNSYWSEHGNQTKFHVLLKNVVVYIEHWKRSLSNIQWSLGMYMYLSKMCREENKKEREREIEKRGNEESSVFYECQ